MKIYTILFLDGSFRTSGIVVVSYTQGDTAPCIIRHAHEKGSAYVQAYLLTETGFDDFLWARQIKRDTSLTDVEAALRELQSRLDG